MERSEAKLRLQLIYAKSARLNVVLRRVYRAVYARSANEKLERPALTSLAIRDDAWRLYRLRHIALRWRHRSNSRRRQRKMPGYALRTHARGPRSATLRRKRAVCAHGPFPLVPAAPTRIQCHNASVSRG